MDDPLVISLVVSGIGMLLLFLALALLYGLMHLMTAVLRERSKEEARGRGQEAGGRGQEARGSEKEARGKGQEVEGGGREVSDRKWRAAVIGVALARAELEAGGIGGPGAEGVGGCRRVSGWRAFHQRQQLTSGVRRGRGQ